MDLHLRGRTALITGASRGIGLAIARRFAEAGANVMLSSRREAGLSAAAGELAGLEGAVDYRVAHAGDPQQAAACVEATVARFGALDVLVNNAASNPYFGPLADLDQARAAKTVEVNQLGVLWWSQCAVRAGMAERQGSIINIASIGGMAPEPGIGWYNVTKAAVIHLTRQLALELAPGIRVNALAPGLVTTDFARTLWEGREEAISAHIPMRRLGRPDDIATAALFLASDAASWITGHTLVVDGGSSDQPSGAVG
jgi:NAD(P)-dependent dehydrogenase (short-subunit alcohol dehydrogenase family)